MFKIYVKKRIKAIILKYILTKIYIELKIRLLGSETYSEEGMVGTDLLNVSSQYFKCIILTKNKYTNTCVQLYILGDSFHIF